MNTILWVVQGLVAFAMFSSGALKIVRSKEQLAAAGFKWTEDYSATPVKLIGLAEVLGAIGVVVPWATHILPQLTPIAALCLAIIMAGAAYTHLRRNEGMKSAMPANVLALLCLYIAWGRHGVLF